MGSRMGVVAVRLRLVEGAQQTPQFTALHGSSFGASMVRRDSRARHAQGTPLCAQYNILF